MKVYLIDDDPDFHMLMKSILKRYDFSLEAFLKPEDFLKRFKESEPDLCILDLNLDMSDTGQGFQLLKAIRNVIGFKIPIYIISKRGERADVLKAMEFGATDFIPKPIDEFFLVNKLSFLFPNNSLLNVKKEKMVKIDSEDSNAVLYTDFEIVKVGMNGIEVKSEFALPKEMILRLDGNLLEKIYGKKILNFKVISSQKVEDENNCALTFLQREYELEEIKNLRKYLALNKIKEDLS